MQTSDVVEINPEIQGGTPVIKGTRLPVSSIIARLEGGDSIEDLVADYPYINRSAFEAVRDR